jgi:two-component system response regulator
MRHRSVTPVERPVGSSVSPAATRRESEPGRGGRAGPWILLVEDNAYDEALALRAFRKNGLASCVVVARDGLEALSHLGDGDDGRRALPEDVSVTPAVSLPQLVVLDLQLPRLDGFGVLRRLRARPATRLVPVVVLSSSLEREDVAASYALGANSYIRKPVDFAQFVVTTAQLGLYWLSLNEPCLPLEGG